MREFQFLKAFYDTPGHRLRAHDAIRAGTAVRYTPSELTPFHARTNAAVRVDGDWWILTPRGLQWFDEQLSLLMSRAE